MKFGNLTPYAMSSGQNREAWKTIMNVLTTEDKQYRASWSAGLQRFVLFGYNDPENQERLVKDPDSHTVTATSTPGRYGFRNVSEFLTGERAQGGYLGEFLLYWRERGS